MIIPKSCYFATSNAGKLVEMQDLMRQFFPEVKELLARAPKNAIEDKETFVENALIKAKALLNDLAEEGLKEFCILSDDSGLTVDALKGEPGVRSARYAGEPCNSEKNIEKLLNELKNIQSPQERMAHFQCALAFIVVSSKNDTYQITTVQGSCNGWIGFEKKGQKGFGYDSIFIDEASQLSFAELGDDVKNKISHRYDAFVKLRKLVDNV